MSEFSRPNIENGGSRISDELETFTSTLMGMSKGVRRGYVYYQTCNTCGDKGHECVIIVNPELWHRKEGRTTSEPFLPTFEASLDFAKKTGLPITSASLEWGSDGRPFVRDMNENTWSWEDFANHLWKIHCNHVEESGCAASLRDPVHHEGKTKWDLHVGNGTAEINDLFRIIYGVGHTDTDLLLVNRDGTPLLIIEDYKYDPTKEKFISYSKSLSCNSGGGIVAKVRYGVNLNMRMEGDDKLPLIEELFDTTHGRYATVKDLHGKNVVLFSNVRGYNALGQILVNHPVWKPHLR
jgi:hypothetical protein